MNIKAWEVDKASLFKMKMQTTGWQFSISLSPEGSGGRLLKIKIKYSRQQMINYVII